jgi:hypothetical protein
MDTLPQSTPQATAPTPAVPMPAPSIPTPTSPSGGVAKEVEAIRSVPQEAPTITEVGQEMPLSPDVSHVGVSIHPTTVEIPKTVQQLGVKPVGHTAPVTLAPTVVLPLTDEKIAEGLHQSITSSWRWLAQWCVRRLKELHLAIRANGKQVVREQV